MDSLTVSMAGIQRRKREMVEGLHQMHAERTVASGVELIKGEGRFVAPRTIEVTLNGGGTRRVEGERVFLVLGSRATMPNVPGLAGANPMTRFPALLSETRGVEAPHEKAFSDSGDSCASGFAQPILHRLCRAL